MEPTISLRQAVVFSILMAHGNGGITWKSPDYILEKLGSCCSMTRPEGLLDMVGLGAFHAYARRWNRPEWLMVEGEDLEIPV